MFDSSVTEQTRCATMYEQTYSQAGKDRGIGYRPAPLEIAIYNVCRTQVDGLRVTFSMKKTCRGGLAMETLIRKWVVTLISVSPLPPW